MKLLIAADEHFYKTPDGKYWSVGMVSYPFWQRYLHVFNEIRVACRVKYVEQVSDDLHQVDGPGVEVFDLPFYQGPKQLIGVYLKTKKKMLEACQGCDAAIFRMPSQTGHMAYHAWNKDKPFAGEVVEDPVDGLKSMSFYHHPLHWALDQYICHRLKKFCIKANGVSYVTHDRIQKNFPSHARLYGETDKFFEEYYSSIKMDDNAFSGPRKFCPGKSVIDITISDVSMNSNRKGIDIFLKVIKKAVDSGYDVTGHIIGDGSKCAEYKQLASDLGIGKRVIFTGLLGTPEQIRQVLRETDVFVLPTKAEGLPRGLLEAMAQGLPVLSTGVGGIPEILQDRYCFDPMDVDGFANMLCYLMDHPEELEDMSKNNFETSAAYKNDVLQARRNRFYGKLKSLVPQEDN